MINFTPYASGSKANMYIADDGHTKVLIEMGLPIKKIKKVLGFGLSGIAGACLSHAHKDHSRSAVALMKAAVDIYMSRATAEALGLSGHRLHIVEPMKQFTLGTWTILPFDTRHEVEGPLGFLLANRQREKLLFATDTFYVPYRVEGLAVIAIECNYALDILRENVAEGVIERGRKNRTMRSHMSLDTVKSFLKANDLSRLQEIHLIHLSDQNSDAERFKREIAELTGKPTYIA